MDVDQCPENVGTVKSQVERREPIVILIGAAKPGMHERMWIDLPGVPNVGERVELLQKEGPPTRWTVQHRTWVIADCGTRGQAKLDLVPFPRNPGPLVG